MFTAFLIASDSLRFDLLQGAAIGSKDLLLLRTFDRYPSASELVKVLRPAPPEVMLLDLDDVEHSLRLAQLVHATWPEIAIVGVEGGSGLPGDASVAGVTHAVQYPCNSAQLKDGLDAAIHAARAPICEPLLAFLPAKAGGGCSTVVLNTAAMLARQLGKRVLLMDTDLRSGTLGFALERTFTGSLQHALIGAHQLDRFAWDRYLTEFQGVHLLLSDGTVPVPLPSWKSYHAVLRFAEPQYDSILVDLPEVVNPGTAELVRCAKNVFVVCTQEVLSLKLAERRLKELAALGIPSEKVQLLVNRWQTNGVPPAEVAGILRHPIAAVFPNDYQGLTKALLKGHTVPLDTPLGAAFLQFASGLAGVAVPAAADDFWPVTRILRALVKRA